MTRPSGFTYVEICIVAVIVAVLAAIAVPNFLEAKVRAGVARSRAELMTVKIAIEDYHIDHRAYPPNKVKGEPGVWDLTDITTPIAYLSFLPIDVMKTAEIRGSRQQSICELVPYKYLNVEQSHPGGLSFKFHPSEHPSGRPGSSSSGTTVTQPVRPIWDEAVSPYDPNRTPSEFAGYTAALVWGAGPGMTMGNNLMQSVLTLSPEGEARIQVYDPTNGTNSPGEIFFRIP